MSYGRPRCGAITGAPATGCLGLPHRPRLCRTPGGEPTRRQQHAQHPHLATAGHPFKLKPHGDPQHPPPLGQRDSDAPLADRGADRRAGNPGPDCGAAAARREAAGHVRVPQVRGYHHSRARHHPPRVALGEPDAGAADNPQALRAGAGALHARGALRAAVRATALGVDDVLGAWVSGELVRVVPAAEPGAQEQAAVRRRWSTRTRRSPARSAWWWRCTSPARSSITSCSGTTCCAACCPFRATTDSTTRDPPMRYLLPGAAALFLTAVTLALVAARAPPHPPRGTTRSIPRKARCSSRSCRRARRTPATSGASP